MFPVTDDSQTIINCLLKEAGKYKVEIIMQSEVQSIESTGNGWLVKFMEDARGIK